MKKGIILVHEFWGVNEQMKRVAERLEKEGFEVLLADLYKGKVAKTAEEARAMKDDVRDDEALQILESGVKELESRGIARDKIAIWGFCMGGSFSYLAAASGMKIGAFVIFYGSRISADEGKSVKIEAPILGVFGAMDKAIPAELVNAFRSALDKLSKPNEIHIYSDADHAFFNEERASYNEKAAKDAWERTLSFLNKHLS